MQWNHGKLLSLNVLVGAKSPLRTICDVRANVLIVWVALELPGNSAKLWAAAKHGEDHQYGAVQLVKLAKGGKQFAHAAL